MAKLLQDLLTGSAGRFPDRQAVCFGDAAITYRGLESSTNKLAGLLRERGVQKGDRVGLHLDKSIESIVGIHAILKSGAAYVPLDPNAPSARCSYILRDCGVRHLLTSSKKIDSVRKMFPEQSPLETAVLMDDDESSEAGPATSTVHWAEVMSRTDTPSRLEEPRDEDLAYILYTSGSTGVPKGVMISQRNALNFVEWAREAFDLGPEDRLSNHAPLHFDLSIFDIFGAFSAGATVVLVPGGISTFPIRLADWIDENRISIWYSVPSVLSMMVTRGRLERHAFESLRAILFAGEVFPVKYLRELMRLIPHAAFHNLYGPTETNVITWYPVGDLDAERTTPVPIGRACAGAVLFAVRPDGTLVKDPGQEGELCARGACVALGYWGQPDSTSRSFSEGEGGPHDRTYRTGDLVTRDEVGNWIYLGRLDDMVKSRGYRIELGEIEATLYAHPEIGEVAALAVPDELIGNRIEALVVPIPDTSPRVKDLKRFCASRLPSYMIPERIGIRKALPKTSTGKVDKTALLKSL